MAQIVEAVDEINHVFSRSADGAESRTFGVEVEYSPEDAVFE